MFTELFLRIFIIYFSRKNAFLFPERNDPSKVTTPCKGERAPKNANSESNEGPRYFRTFTVVFENDDWSKISARITCQTME